MFYYTAISVTPTPAKFRSVIPNHDRTRTLQDRQQHDQAGQRVPGELCMTGESIFVVEDEGFVALQIKELLEQNGYNVPGVLAYGEDAVQLAEKDPPDLICMDINLMGKIDGIEAARKIHEHHDIPIIYLTAFSDGQRIARARETVPYSYIVKPYNERELLASVDMALHRHKIDLQLRESMERYRAIVDNAAEGILLVSCDNKKILEANPASIRLLGYTAAELNAMTLRELNPTRGQDRGWEEQACVAGGWSGEVQIRCRDDTLREVELATSLIHRGGIAELSCLIAHDVTDRKLAENAVREANRKLNLLSGVTRHDIINQLTVLSGFLELSVPEVTGTRLEEYVDRELHAVSVIRRMINFTKEYEEIGQKKPGWYQPDAIINRLAATTRYPGIEIKSNIGNLEIYADPLVERVFHNLLDNTSRHGVHARIITITATPGDKNLVILWKDDGIGVPDTDKEKIFERGFGKNTGLGLFLAREILGLTGITIRENGISGKGSAFEITVPQEAFRYGEAPKSKE